MRRSKQQLIPYTCKTLKPCFVEYRYPSLTSLELSRALLSSPKGEFDQRAWEMPALKELLLDKVLLNAFWLAFIATSLTTITQLTFESCRLEEQDVADVDFIAANSMR